MRHDATARRSATAMLAVVMLLLSGLSTAPPASAAPLTVTVIVETSRGIPVERANVSIRTTYFTGWDGREAETNPAGEATFTVPAAGLYTVDLYNGPASVEKLVLVAPGLNPIVRLTAWSPASISFTAMSAVADTHTVDYGVEQLVDGKWRTAYHGRQAERVSGGWRVTVDALAPGTYRIDVGGWFHPQTITAGTAVRAGEDVDLGRHAVVSYSERKLRPTISRPTAGFTTREWDPDGYAMMCAQVSGAQPGARGTVRAEVLDRSGKVLGPAGWVSDSELCAIEVTDIGTYGPYRFRLQGDEYQHTVTSPLSKRVSVTRRASTVKVRLEQTTIERYATATALITVTGPLTGELKIRVDGKYAHTVRLRSVHHVDQKRGPKTYRVKLHVPGKPGRHTISVRRIASEYDKGAVAKPVHVNIVTTKLSGRPTVKVRPFAKGARPKVTVSVPRATTAIPVTGTVRFYVNGRSVATARLKASDNGRTTVTLPVKPTGRIKVRAVYEGSKRLPGAVSKTVTVKPTK